MYIKSKLKQFQTYKIVKIYDMIRISVNVILLLFNKIKDNKYKCNKTKMHHPKVLIFFAIKF